MKPPPFASVPTVLQGQVEALWQQFMESDHPPDMMFQDEVIAVLPRVWSTSEYVARQCIQSPDLLLELQQSGDLLRAYPDEVLAQRVHDLVSQIQNEGELAGRLRQIRKREMVRIMWRDITGWADLTETTCDLSDLADSCIAAALNTLYEAHCVQFGTPYYHDGQSMNLVVLGMGKLGAKELNVSSDIDLIFTFAEEGETRGAHRALSHSEFFTRLGQKLINALDQMTAEGMVFRVDMRLRPFGDGGPLVSSFDALETYYQLHGREWERYAMIKARVVAGDRSAGEQLMALLRPFVYRRYLDFGAYDALREMKAMISREVKRKGLAQNIKLGAGGIREVEFIGQVFQLIRGGREPALQQRRLLRVLEQLQANDSLPAYVVEELKQAYTFLRNTEHRLQEYADQQTHNLPRDEIAQLRLAYSMGFESWAQFEQMLNRHRQRVHNHFEQVFEAPQTGALEDSNGMDLEGVWHGHLDNEQVSMVLAEAGYGDASTVSHQLDELRRGRLYHSLSKDGRSRLDKLLPLLLGAVGQAAQPDQTFVRVLEIIIHIARRSVYLALLLETPLALSQLVKLCSASPWITRYLKLYPILLDDLIDARTLYAPPDKPALAAELGRRMATLAEDDHEQAMENLRHFKHTNVLRVAAADISGALPLMKVSDHLSWIAEVVLQEALQQAWRHLLKRHGRPHCKIADQPCDAGFAVIAYGKLGGLELGYGSDLDLVFLHGSDEASAMTDGEHPLAIPVFYARLGQRLIHILTTFTPAGVLYEVDMRLRPDGASGMLVSNLTAFDHYQRSKAWLWEHQALVRARPVAGDPLVADHFSDIRRNTLMIKRDKAHLRQEVRDMRLRMREQLSKKISRRFDLKQGAGGIVDIEFIVQYGVLAWANEYPQLVDYTDNIRILAGFAQAGLMTAEEVDLLSNAYRTYRSRIHQMALQEQPGFIPDDEYKDFRRAVSQFWQTWLEH